MSFITTQIGMFSYSGLSKDQMVRLRSEFGVYGTDTGRMCVAALNSKNIDYVCESIAKVIGWVYAIYLMPPDGGPAAASAPPKTPC
jgi:hypothetical protein